MVHSRAAAPGTPVRLHHIDGRPIVTSTDGSLIGEANMPLNPSRRGSMRSAFTAEPGRIDLSCLRPDDLWLVRTARSRPIWTWIRGT
jgi:hypothetical protein